jgi:hypothetical protein
MFEDANNRDIGGEGSGDGDGAGEEWAQSLFKVVQRGGRRKSADPIQRRRREAYFALGMVGDGYRV